MKTFDVKQKIIIYHGQAEGGGYVRPSKSHVLFSLRVYANIDNIKLNG